MADAPYVLLTAEPLSLDALTARVSDPEHGATVTFAGTTRREGGAREVVALDYEAYGDMAAAELAAIAAEAAARYASRVAVAHRVGRVAVGEPSVAIAASAGHRPEAFAACRHVIEEIKARVPIWKQAVFADGTAEWQDGLPPGPAGAH